MRRVRSVTVHQIEGLPRWCAALRIDHLPTDWTCGHQHISEVAARPCQAVLLADVDSYLDHPEFHEQSTGVAGGPLSGPVYAVRRYVWTAGTRRRTFQAGGIYTG